MNCEWGAGGKVLISWTPLPLYHKFPFYLSSGSSCRRRHLTLENVTLSNRPKALKKFEYLTSRTRFGGINLTATDGDKLRLVESVPDQSSSLEVTLHFGLEKK